MDIVDININIHKYISNKMKRHDNAITNISFWNQLDKNNINLKNTKIINKYSKFLNQRNIQIIVKCIEKKINIIQYYINSIIMI